MSVPIFSAPDEHSHVIRAASVARGEVRGSDTVVDFPPYLVTYVDVPIIYDLADQVMLCYLHRPEVDASCAGSFVGSHEVGQVATLAGRYPPYYYALVAPGMWASGGPAGVYASRLLGALASSAFLASAVLSILSFRRRVALLGLALALTPTALYLAGMVNPNGLEIAAAASFWAAGAAIVHHWRGAETTRLLVRLGVAGAGLSMIRGAGWVWLVCGLTVLALTVGVADGRTLLGRRDVRLTLGALALSMVAALGWSRYAGAYDLLGTPTTDSLRERLAVTAGQTRGSLHEMIANFGFSDAKAPGLVQVVWQILLVVVVVAGFRMADRRVKAALALLVGGVIGVPIILETLQAAKVGYFWLGRYTLPLAAGLPILAAAQLAVRSSPAAPEPAGDGSEAGRLRTAVEAGIAALVLCHGLAWYWVLRRYAVGTDGEVLYLFGDVPWQPPIPVVLPAAAVVTGLGLLGYGAWRLPGASEPVAARR